MSVMANDDIEHLRDEVMQLESKVAILGEGVKTILEKVKKLEKIARDKGLMNDKSDEEVCVIC